MQLQESLRGTWCGVAPREKSKERVDKCVARCTPTPLSHWNQKVRIGVKLGAPTCAPFLRRTPADCLNLSVWFEGTDRSFYHRRAVRLLFGNTGEFPPGGISRSKTTGICTRRVGTSRVRLCWNSYTGIQRYQVVSGSGVGIVRRSPVGTMSGQRCYIVVGYGVWRDAP